MGLPNVLPDVTISSDNEKMELYSNEHPFKLPLRRKEFSQEVEYKKFIKNVEQTVRRSSEYREWKQYIIDVLGINSCIITQESMSDCGLEIHHHIPSLYVLVSTMVNQKLETGEPFCSFDLCTDIIELHFQNKVGYVPLITSMHEKFHNGALEIPINYVRGRRENPGAAPPTGPAAK